MRYILYDNAMTMQCNAMQYNAMHLTPLANNQSIYLSFTSNPTGGSRRRQGRRRRRGKRNQKVSLQSYHITPHHIPHEQQSREEGNGMERKT